MSTVSRVAKKKTQPTLEATVEIFAQIAEKHLASMPQEEATRTRCRSLVKSLLLDVIPSRNLAPPLNAWGRQR
jgi:hypothetical protein